MEVLWATEGGRGRRRSGEVRFLLSLSFLWRRCISEFSLVIVLPKVPETEKCREKKGYRKLRISHELLRSLTVLKVTRDSIGLNPASNWL